jgi:hypothetical protein
MSSPTHSQDSSYSIEKYKEEWEFMDSIEPLTPPKPSKDEVKLCLDAYKRAAEYDDFMFGNHDVLDEFTGITT